VPGRGALGKTLVVTAVELREPRGYGRARMSVIPDAVAKTLREFLITTVEPGSTVVTDGWAAYPKACRDWFVHEPHPVSGSGHEANELLPAVHRVASLCKRWLLGTHQGAALPEHMQSYLEEFCFRFNRRHSRARGLLFYRRRGRHRAAPATGLRRCRRIRRRGGRPRGRCRGDHRHPPTTGNGAGHHRSGARRHRHRRPHHGHPADRLLGAALLGAALPIINVAALTLLQHTTPNPLMGRVTAAFDLANTVPYTVSIALGAVLGLVVTGCALPRSTPLSPSEFGPPDPPAPNRPVAKRGAKRKAR